ncbi:hypothetical protein [Microlunatus ginsengisoli]|uniref:Uncharacterized protein n=1 Tax=Microlunatus ginsengisoli TaxID=363863 RepID=A0ABP7AF00_9ACTN
MYDRAEVEPIGSGGPRSERAGQLVGAQSRLAPTAPIAGADVAPLGLLQLQRAAGNAAVGSLLSSRPAANRTPGAADRSARRLPAPTTASSRSGAAEPSVQRCGGEVHEGCGCAAESEEMQPAPVQRCGGEVHEGCSCVNEEAPPVGDGTGPVTRPAREPSGDETTPSEGHAVQRFTDGTPDAPSPELPDGSPYASLDSELLAMLGRTLTAKSFWRWRNDRPTNLGAALDGLGAADLNTLVQLKRRCDAFGLWHNITTMTNLWTTSSLGIDFTGGGGMQSDVAGAEKFCRDTAVGESYHPGKACWREMVEPGTPGLHVCLPDSIHIDPHQTVDGKGWSWSWGSSGPAFGTACTYSFLAFLGHMMDVEGHRPVNPFTHHGEINSRIAGLLPQLEQRVAEHPDISTQRDDIRALQTEMQALAPILRRWSLQGKEGGDDEEARSVLGQLNAADGRLGRADDAIRGSNGPDPTVVYSP